MVFEESLYAAFVAVFLVFKHLGLARYFSKCFWKCLLCFRVAFI